MERSEKLPPQEVKRQEIVTFIMALFENVRSKIGKKNQPAAWNSKTGFDGELF